MCCHFSREHDALWYYNYTVRTQLLSVLLASMGANLRLTPIMVNGSVIAIFMQTEISLSD